MSLFDASPYGPERPARKPASRGPSLTTVAVLANGIWKGVSRRQSGVVHAITTSPPDRLGRLPVVTGSAVSYCGIFVEPHTYAPGEIVPGCGACLNRGAPCTKAEAA